MTSAPLMGIGARAHARLADGCDLGEVSVLLHREASLPDDPAVREFRYDPWWGCVRFGPTLDPALVARVQASEPVVLGPRDTLPRTWPCDPIAVELVFGAMQPAGLEGLFRECSAGPPES